MNVRNSRTNYVIALSDVAGSLSDVLEDHLQRIADLEERMDAVVNLQGRLDRRVRALDTRCERLEGKVAEADAETVIEDEEAEENAEEMTEVEWPTKQGLYYIAASRDGVEVEGPASVYGDGIILLPECQSEGTRVLIKEGGWRLAVCAEVVAVPKRLVSDLDAALKTSARLVLKVAHSVVDCANAQGIDMVGEG